MSRCVVVVDAGRRSRRRVRSRVRVSVSIAVPGAFPRATALAMSIGLTLSGAGLGVLTVATQPQTAISPGCVSLNQSRFDGTYGGDFVFAEFFADPVNPRPASIDGDVPNAATIVVQCWPGVTHRLEANDLDANRAMPVWAGNASADVVVRARHRCRCVHWLVRELSRTCAPTRLRPTAARPDTARVRRRAPWSQREGLPTSRRPSPRRPVISRWPMPWG
jgi:hypothetical protein